MAQINEAFILPGLVPANNLLLEQGTYIALIYATYRPPHLALLIEGKLFSLSIKGPKPDMPLGLQLRAIQSRKIPTVFLQLKTALYLHNNQLFKAAHTHTMGYSRVEVGVATCLSPIKNFCASVFNLDSSRMETIFDLLPILYQKKLVVSALQYNMEPYLKEGNFCLKPYSMQDIYNSIVQSEGLLVCQF
jgi:hypothetical protein